MSDITLTTVDAFMKELYDGQKPMDVAVQAKPLLKWVPKKDNFVGDVYPLPISYAHGAGRAAVFATAQSNASGGTHKKFLVTRVSDYAVLTIDAEAMKASKNNLGAFVEARKWETDGMLDEMGRSAAIALYGQGYGVLGTVGSISSNTITFANAGEARKFRVGMVVQALEPDFSDWIDSGDTATVTAVDADANTVTISTVAAISGLAADDLLIQAGDAGTGSVSKSKITGLAGWLPSTAPTSGDSFFGVDRSADVTALAGHRLSQTGVSIEENILQLSEDIASEAGRPDTVFLSHKNFSKLVRSLSTKVEYQGAGGTEEFGFSALKMHSSAGVLSVVPDPFAPENVGYVLEKSTWMLKHLEGFPHFVKDDGLMALRGASSDNIEIRIRYWAQLCCKAPGHNGRFAI